MSESVTKRQTWEQREAMFFNKGIASLLWAECAVRVRLPERPATWFRPGHAPDSMSGRLFFASPVRPAPRLEQPGPGGGREHFAVCVYLPVPGL